LDFAKTEGIHGNHAISFEKNEFLALCLT